MNNRLSVTTLVTLLVSLAISQPLISMQQSQQQQKKFSYIDYALPACALIIGAVAGTYCAYKHVNALAPSLGLVSNINQLTSNSITNSATILPESILSNSSSLVQKGVLFGITSIGTGLLAGKNISHPKLTKEKQRQFNTLKRVALSLATGYLAFQSMKYLFLPHVAFNSLLYSIERAKQQASDNITTHIASSLPQTLETITSGQPEHGVTKKSVTLLSWIKAILSSADSSGTTPPPTVPDDFSDTDL